GDIRLLTGLGAQRERFLKTLSRFGEIRSLLEDVAELEKRAGATALAPGLLRELQRLRATLSRSRQVSGGRLSIRQANQPADGKERLVSRFLGQRQRLLVLFLRLADLVLALEQPGEVPHRGGLIQLRADLPLERQGLLEPLLRRGQLALFLKHQPEVSERRDGSRLVPDVPPDAQRFLEAPLGGRQIAFVQ